MPLPPAIEFLSMQRDRQGASLCYWGISYIEAIIPANATVQWTVGPARYASYNFRLQIDPAVVPGAFAATFQIYGTWPYTATVQSGASSQLIDSFVRVTVNQPILTTVQNLTNVAQLWISADQYLVVSSEEDFKELERRLEIYFRQPIDPKLGFEVRQ